MESNDNRFIIRIFLTNGEKICYKSGVTTDNAFNVGGQIEDALKANYIGMDMDGKLTIIPFQHILKIEIDPTPDVLLAHAVKNVESIDE